MSDWEISEEQLLRVNHVLQRADDVLVHNCLTRTAQESKLFPVLPYLDLTMIDSYYRYPDLLRAVAERMSPEEVGHRAREVTTTLTHLTGWATLTYYLNGRSLLMRNGLLRPEDNLEDLCFMIDFHQRFIAAFKRSGAHLWNLEAGDIGPVHEERVLQVFEADAFEADDALRAAATKFVAATTQYNFLIHCESRSGLSSSGPYRVGERLLLHTRDFLNLTDCGLSWMDDIAPELPFANLTLALITDGVAVEVTDWGTAYTTPEDYQGSIVGVGLYTSDLLCDRYVPVGMGSARELTDTLGELTAEVTAATRRLYSRFAGMSFTEMVEAGMNTYLRAPVDMAMMAGTYRQSDWDMVDDRTRRLWELYNEEYAFDAYVDNFAGMVGLRGSHTEYYLHPISYGVWRRAGGAGPLPTPGRYAGLIPAAVMRGHDYSRRVNTGGLSGARGSFTLPAKTGRYTFACGRLDEDELNDRARAFDSPLLDTPWRLYDEAAVKWRWADPDVDAMYRYGQERSRLLHDRGAALRRDDIDRLRAEAGERPGSTIAGGRPAEVVA